MKKQRFRLRQVFWLDLNHPVEGEVANQIAELKERRLFASTVRDGIRLICDLRSGRLDILTKMFPWIEEAFYQRFAVQQPDIYLYEQIERLEQLLLQQGNTPIKTTNSGPKQLDVPQIAAPDYDDADDLLIVKQGKSDGSSAQNFLDSAFGLIQ